MVTLSICHTKKIAIIIAAIVLLITGFILIRTDKDPTPKSTEPVVGGDRDAHGCIGSAGYTWCETKSKCLRVWEEKCR